MMELAGTEGVLVSGGALTGKSVQFFDLESKRCVLNSLLGTLKVLSYDDVNLF